MPKTGFDCFYSVSVLSPFFSCFRRRCSFVCRQRALFSGCGPGPKLLAQRRVVRIIQGGGHSRCNWWAFLYTDFCGAWLDQITVWIIHKFELFKFKLTSFHCSLTQHDRSWIPTKLPNQLVHEYSIWWENSYRTLLLLYPNCLRQCPNSLWQCILCCEYANQVTPSTTVWIMVQIPTWQVEFRMMFILIAFCPFSGILFQILNTIHF